MAHESFDDPGIARRMNELFVCVKVDREERPDVDAAYLQAVQVMTGRGGWPLTVVLTPELEPFWGGTYFPPVSRDGMPGFDEVLEAVAAAWSSREGEVRATARAVARHVSEPAALDDASDADDLALLDAAADVLRASYDPRDGGFERAPKFPPPMALELLLRRERWARATAVAAAGTP